MVLDLKFKFQVLGFVRHFREYYGKNGMNECLMNKDEKCRRLLDELNVFSSDISTMLLAIVSSNWPRHSRGYEACKNTLYSSIRMPSTYYSNILYIVG